MKHRMLVLSLATTTLALAGSAAAQVQVHSLGPAPELSSAYYGPVLSSDGYIIAGARYVWIAGVRQEIDSPPGGSGLGAVPRAEGLSADGGTMIARTSSRQHERLILIEGLSSSYLAMQTAPDECNDGASYYGCSAASADGRIVVFESLHIGDAACGYPGSGGRSRVTRWDRDGGPAQMLFDPADLPGLGTPLQASRAGVGLSGISADGGVVAGIVALANDTVSQAFVWTASDGASRPFVDLCQSSTVSAVSPDGAVLAKLSTPPSTVDWVVWADGGIVRTLDPVSMPMGIDPKAMSSGGEVIVGRIWSSAHGGWNACVVDESGFSLVRDLASGPEFDGYVFQNATAVSPDGMYVIGVGQHPVHGSDLWILRRARAGDANGNDSVDAADLSVLLSQFGSSVTPCTGADFNCDGQINAADLSVLLSTFGT